MEEIEITIDEQGKVNVHIKGIKGPSCNDIEKLIAEALGVVESSRKTSEYYERPMVSRKTEVRR